MSERGQLWVGETGNTPWEVTGVEGGPQGAAMASAEGPTCAKAREWGVLQGGMIGGQKAGMGGGGSLESDSVRASGQGDPRQGIIQGGWNHISARLGLCTLWLVFSAAPWVPWAPARDSGSWRLSQTTRATPPTCGAGRPHTPTPPLGAALNPFYWAHFTRRKIELKPREAKSFDQRHTGCGSQDLDPERLCVDNLPCGIGPTWF